MRTRNALLQSPQIIETLALARRANTILMGIGALLGKDPVIAVAGGEAKAEAILGALHGRYLNVLVTDDTAARKVVALENS